MWGIIIFRALIAVPLASFFVAVTGVLSDIFREKERAFWLVKYIVTHPQEFSNRLIGN